jgi:hypothetical protein
MLTLAEVKLQLGITDSSKDTLLNQLIAQAIAHAKRETQRLFTVEELVEFYDGTNTSKLVLRESPVVSVDEIRLDDNGHYGQSIDSFGDETILIEGVDYAVNGSIVHRINAWWPPRVVNRIGQLSNEIRHGQGNIKVTYHAGFDGMPDDIKDACIQIIARRLETQTGREVASKKMDYVSVSYGNDKDSSSEIASINQVFRSYRKPRF